MGIWDQFKQSDEDSSYVSFDKVNDEAEGTITAMGTVTFTDKNGTKTKPQLTLKTKDGAVKILTVGPVNLLRQVAELGPNVGDHIHVKFVDTQKTGQPSPMKIFEVTITPGTLMANGSAAPVPPPPPVGTALPPVPGYPPPTAEQLADPAYKAWYDANAPKAPVPPPPPTKTPDSPETVAGAQDPF